MSALTIVTPPPGFGLGWRQTALEIWPFAQAPPAYQALSTHGGDEDWVLYCPAALLAARWPWALEQALARAAAGSVASRVKAVDGWGHAETHAVFGGVVVIFAHA